MGTPERFGDPAGVDGLLYIMYVTLAWTQQTRPGFASIHVRFERRASHANSSHERAVDRFSHLSQSPLRVGSADPRMMWPLAPSDLPN